MAKKDTSHQNFLNNLSIFHCFGYIFSSANFTPVETPIVVKNGKDSSVFTLAHDDSAETLWVAAQGISSNSMLKTLRQIKQLIEETLDATTLHINAILIAPTDTPKKMITTTYAETKKHMNKSTIDSDILIFDSAEAAFNYLQSASSEIIPDNKTVYSAYHEYLQTLVEYMNK